MTEAPSIKEALERELSGNSGQLRDIVAAAIRGDGSDLCDGDWSSLSKDRKEGWRGDADRALAAIKEYLGNIVGTDTLATFQPDGERREPSCPFCNRDPFHYVDNGVGMEAVAVTCCDLGDLYFRGAREAPETVELSWEDFTGIGHRLASGLVQDEAGRPYCDPVKQGEAFYLAMYEKNGAHWPANEHQKLWVDMARDYERRRREAIRSARDGGEG